MDGGTRVAYGQEPVHFGCATHYELRDIESERLIEAVDIPQPCGQAPDPKPVEIPQWVADVISKKQAGYGGGWRDDAPPQLKRKTLDRLRQRQAAWRS